MTEDGPNRRTVIDGGLFGEVKVDLWFGLFRDEVRVYKSVYPALGGLMARRTCWHRKDRGQRLYEAIVDRMQMILSGHGEKAEPLPRRWK